MSYISSEYEFPKLCDKCGNPIKPIEPTNSIVLSERVKAMIINSFIEKIKTYNISNFGSDQLVDSLVTYKKSDDEAHYANIKALYRYKDYIIIELFGIYTSLDNQYAHKFKIVPIDNIIDAYNDNTVVSISEYTISVHETDDIHTDKFGINVYKVNDENSLIRILKNDTIDCEVMMCINSSTKKFSFTDEIKEVIASESEIINTLENTEESVSEPVIEDTTSES